MVTYRYIWIKCQSNVKSIQYCDSFLWIDGIFDFLNKTRVLIKNVVNNVYYCLSIEKEEK